jgi:hypothetical protein
LQGIDIVVRTFAANCANCDAARENFGLMPIRMHDRLPVRLDRVSIGLYCIYSIFDKVHVRTCWEQCRMWIWHSPAKAIRFRTDVPRQINFNTPLGAVLGDMHAQVRLDFSKVCYVIAQRKKVSVGLLGILRKRKVHDCDVVNI